jgi:hypothetical protein
MLRRCRRATVASKEWPEVEEEEAAAAAASVRVTGAQSWGFS